MSWVDSIFSAIWNIALWFEGLAWEAKDIPLVGPAISELLYFVYQAFWSLLTPIAHFHDWTYDISQAIASVLTGVQIIALLKNWLDWAQWSWQWIQDAWFYIIGIVDDWWMATMVEVQGWIAIATQGFNDLVVAWSNFWTITWPEWIGNLNDLQAGWDNFWTVTYPNLVSFDWLTSWWNDRLLDLQSLVNTAFLDRDSWWAGWQDWRDQVIEFFTDPFEFLLARFTDWVLGPEE